SNARVVKSDAKVLALKLGVDPTHVNDVLKLSDITGEEIGEDGEPDTAALTKSINAVLETRPFYKSGATQAAGNEFGGNQQQADPFAKETFNLTQIGQMAKTNPGVIGRMQTALTKRK
ncbi:MAG TPA: hypothetical protein VGL77_13640, partial [Armatimonadota bacterium]